MGKRSRRERQQEGLASIPPALLPPPLEAAPPPDAPDAWPRCGYCGSLALHESSRGGWRPGLLRFAGCVVYRCESCGRRFAFAAIGRSKDHRRSASPHRSATRPVEGGRRRLLGALATLVAALLAFLAAVWLINRSEQRRLEGEPTPPQ
jgi:DNA-directed RNA polymerase subunit RPC12/RpoP